jgi:hypothetical protein
MSEFTEPRPLVGSDASVSYGWARQPLFEVNMRSASSVHRHPAGAWRLKRWEYFYVATPTVLLASQIAHIGYLANLVTYLYDIKRDVLMQRTSTIPFGTKVSLAEHPKRGMSSARLGASTLLKSEVVKAGKHFTVDWPRFNGPDSLHVDLLLEWPDELESLSVVDPLRSHRFAYTTKVMCMPAAGTIRVGKQTWQCKPSETLGALDWSRGFLESVTEWKWATASGRDGQGRVVGFNLCSGFHDGGDNENAVVCDGRLTKLGPVSFARDDAHILRPWHISSADGRADLSFVPLTDRQARTDAGPLQSHIHQLIGTYSGRLPGPGADSLTISDVLGVAEDHYARW